MSGPGFNGSPRVNSPYSPLYYTGEPIKLDNITQLKLVSAIGQHVLSQVSLRCEITLNGKTVKQIHLSWEEINVLANSGVTLSEIAIDPSERRSSILLEEVLKSIDWQINGSPNSQIQRPKSARKSSRPSGSSDEDPALPSDDALLF